MNEQTKAYIEELLNRLQESFSQDETRIPMMVLEDPEDSDCWIQFSSNTLDVRYPFQEEPESRLQALNIPIPSSLEAPEWASDDHLAFHYDGSQTDEAACFLAAYADAVFERSPVGWTLEEDSFDNEQEEDSQSPDDEFIAKAARSMVDDLLQPEPSSGNEPPVQARKKERTPFQHAVRFSLIVGAVLYGGIFFLKGPGAFFSFYKSGRPENRISVGDHCYLRHCSFSELRRLKAESSAQSRDGFLLPEGSFVSPTACCADWIQVETPDGRRGFIPPLGPNSQFAEIIRHLPRINPKFVFCTTYKRMRTETIGKKLRNVEKRYGPASSVLPNGGTREAYFQHIDSTRDGKRYKGMFLTLDASDTIVDIQPDAMVNYPLLAKLPLVKFFREREFFGLHYHSFYQRANWLVSGVNMLSEKVRKAHWSIRFIVGVISALIGLLFYAVLFSVPHLLVYPFSSVILHSPRIENGLAELLIVILNAFSFYLFSIYREVPDGGWLPLIFLFIVFVSWVKAIDHDITYHRCPNCHLMNTALDKGSTFLGETEAVSVGTYDVYKGTRETDTEIIKKYERHRREKTETFDNFDDHRQCSNCGYRWDVSREVKTSESTREV